MDQSGLFVVEAVPTGQLYVGSTRNGRARRNELRSELRRGDAAMPKLQAACDSLGEDNFVFHFMPLDLDEALAIECELLEIGACELNTARTSRGSAGRPRKLRA